MKATRRDPGLWLYNVARLAAKLEAEAKPGTFVVSHKFAIPGWPVLWFVTPSCGRAPPAGCCDTCCGGGRAREEDSLLFYHFPPPVDATTAGVLGHLGEEGAAQVPYRAGQANGVVAPALSDIVEVEAPAVDEEPAQWRFKWGGAWGDK